jgi:SIR2-like domain
MFEVISTDQNAPTNLKRADAIDEKAWERLLRRINMKQCTPFLGPETCFYFSVPSASAIAEDWANRYGYPLEDRGNLPRVAQYLAYDVNNGDTKAVKEELVEQFRKLKPPDFSDVNQPYRVLASLPLRIYVNAHYFGFISLALQAQHKDPRRAICAWRAGEFSNDYPALERGYEPTPATPLVYYLFGHIDEPSSLVLTEDDYLDFLVRTSAEPELIPQPVQYAMVNHSLLFFGYQMTDLDFRVILRSLNSLWQRRQLSSGTHFTVQLVHVGDKKATSEQIERVKTYIGRYCLKCTNVSIGVYWGSTRDFIVELRQRWEDYSARNPVN